MRLRNHGTACRPSTAFFFLPHTSRTVSHVPEADSIVTCALQRLRGTRPNSYELLGHHVTALLLAVLVYYAQAFQFYAPAFMGLPELSSLPLAFVDLFKHFPSLRKGVPAANELARNIFAVTFLAVRGCYWPYCSVAFWRSAFAAMADENAQLLARPIVHTFLVCNVLMTALQWYWASIILTAIVRLLRGDPRHKDM